MASTPRTEEPGFEVVRWYTRARKFPQLIGKTPNGGTIWGGPYTYTQLIVGVAVLALGLKTTWLWGRFGLIGNAVVVLGVAYGVTVLVGRLPMGMRNPLSIGAGVVRALTRPAQGSLGGTALRIRAPHVARSRVVVNRAVPSLGTDRAPSSRLAAIRGDRRRRRREDAEVPLAQVRRPAPLRPTPATNRVAQAQAPALTGVQRLLASASSTHQQEDD